MLLREELDFRREVCPVGCERDAPVAWLELEERREPWMAERESPGGVRAGVPGEGRAELGWRSLSREPFQVAAIAMCMLLGAAMVLNNQMGGEAMWFWYATTFHRGLRLYADLHIALQPLFVLLVDGWMRMFGERLWVTQIPSLLEIGLMAAGTWLVLRESGYGKPGLRDWEKGIVLLGTFALTVSGHSYRFDDYHVLTENLILYALLLLLWLARATGVRRQMVLVGGLGLVAGLSFTTRVTDGAALVSSSMILLPLLLRQRRAVSVVLFLVVAAVTVMAVVSLTGDTLGAYLSSSILRAAGSKGGTGSIFAAPFLVLKNTGPMLLMVGKRALGKLLVIVAVGPLVARFWRPGLRYLFGLQMLVAALLFLPTTHLEHELLLKGVLISTVVLVVTPLLYVLTPLALAKFAGTRGEMDRRWLLVMLPLAEWASYSAGAAAEPLTNYYAPVSLFLLLVAVVEPFGRWASWARVSFVTLLALLGVSTLTSKALIPYSWQNYKVAPMFEDRAWYRHPVYGPMYIDRDLLAFSRRVCADMGVTPGQEHPELLSLPYPFPNYFCDTPPWHNYVQTFFDTSTRATIEGLMAELNTAPPKWIVYQRQMLILGGAERLYNHGRPLAQRDLDTLIKAKLASGQWTLVDQSDYLGAEHGDGWFIIRTHP